MQVPPERAAAPVRPGRLTVAVQPWAEVFVDGQRAGEGALVTVSELPPGPHRVVLRNPEFPEIRESVVVRSGEEARLGISLWAHVARATIQVHPWAEVTLDGRALGAVPPQRTLILAPGAHTLVLTHPGLGTWTETVHARAGETPTLRYNLTRLLGGETGS
jgi:hypothetical protein